MSTETIYLAIQSIPCGKVATYGDIARIAGLGKGARYIGNVLRALPNGTKLPWHRVVNAKGKLSFPVESAAYTEQKTRLTEEGVLFKGDKINLAEYRWHAF